MTARESTTIHLVEDVTVLTLGQPMIVNTLQMQEYLLLLEQYIDIERVRFLILDLRAVEMIADGMVKILKTANGKLKAVNRGFVLCNVRETVRDSLWYNVRQQARIQIAGSLEEACAHLHSSPVPL